MKEESNRKDPILFILFIPGLIFLYQSDAMHASCKSAHRGRRVRVRFAPQRERSRPRAGSPRRNSDDNSVRGVAQWGCSLPQISRRSAATLRSPFIHLRAISRYRRANSRLAFPPPRPFRCSRRDRIDVATPARNEIQRNFV